MPWTKVEVSIDADKLGAGRAEAGQITAVHELPAFSFTARVDASNRAGFVSRAKAALEAFQAQRTREAGHETTLLNQLNA